MKRYLLFLTIFLTIAGNMSGAETVTIADFNNLPTQYGSFSNSMHTFTTNAASGGVGLTITASDVTLGSKDVNTSYGKCFSLTTSDTNAHTVTITAPSGYVIEGYSIGASANTANYPHTLTAADGTSISITSLGYNSYKFQYLTVSGLSANATTFTMQTQNGGNTLYIAYFTVTLRKYESSITSGKYYRLHSAPYANKAMREQGGVLTTEEPNDETYSQIWKITAKNGGYSLQNAMTGKYVQAATTYSQQFATGSSAVTFYSGTRTVDNLTQFWFSTSNTQSEYRAIHCADTRDYIVVSWQVSDSNASYWYLEEVEVDEDVIAALQAQTMPTSGYYRLTNAAYDSRSMADGGGSVTTPTTADNYSQVWYLTINGSTVTLKNALTERYIQNSPGRSAQYKTDSGSYGFNLISKEDGGKMLFTFQDPNSTWSGLHSAASQSYNVVGWDYTADASWWTIVPVDVDESDLAIVKNSLNTDYTAQLSTYFSDAACTTLKTNYQAMTDAQLRSSMSALPSVLQEMAVCVKNSTWNTAKDATWNNYEKDFRIHQYDIFSNSDLWDDITKTGPFAHLFHPTGIQANSGDVVYLFVGEDVTDSDATLEAECVVGTDRKGATYTLKKGYNAIYVPCDCEIFVSYLLNNTDKSCNDYPDITVHVEGGTCNGCFDMRGHGHTNSDWEWLKKNMFSQTYLHVKGNSTILNCLRERVVDSNNTQNVEGIMNIFDYVFDNLQSLAGCDQWKVDGRYKMMVDNYDNEAGGNPFWGGNYGYSQPGIYYDGIFNYNNLTNVGTNGGNIWVIEHELGHGHQTPINLSGQTESSNNSMAQCVNFLTTNSARGKELFATTRSSRGDGVKLMTERFNQEGGYSWIDLGGFRTNKAYGGDTDTWVANRFLFQLWLYFDYMGNYQPGGGNTGFSFMSDLFDAMRADPLEKSTNKNSPRPATDDYLKLARKCAEVTQTDLSEFFEAWGFWKIEPTVSRANDDSQNKIWEFEDYSTTYIQTSQAQVDEVRNAMKAYSKKGGNIMFLEDRCKGSTLPTYNNASVTSFGETGYYETYDKKITAAYECSVSGTTVTMKNGSGAVGFKVYDTDGNLAAISNTTSFTVTSAVATGISNGTYKVVAAQGDGKDYAMGEKFSNSGDVNGDGEVSIADVTALVNIILGKGGNYSRDAADVNGDGSVTVADVTALVNIILGK